MMSIASPASNRGLGNPLSLRNSGEALLRTTESEYEQEVKVAPTQIVDIDEELEQNTRDQPRTPQQLTIMATAMTRTRTMHSFSGSSSSSAESENLNLQENFATCQECFPTFGMDLRRVTEGSPEVPEFDALLRRTMEPHLRKARLIREKVRNRTSIEVHAAIASSVGVPYTRLRQERPFLYDIHTHPMHEILASTLGVDDLSRLHELDDLQQAMKPLLSRTKRRSFQEAYDNFVTSFCIPLLHSMAISQNLFHGKGSCISYRYQAFPKIRINRPGDASTGPQCGTSNGHSIGYLHFHVPLTAATGTNALYTESHPGKENWHPLITKSVGLGFLFDGARCLHFNMENTTNETSVALDFVVAIYDDRMSHDYVDAESLCDQMILEDQFMDHGFYDEAVIDLSLGTSSWQVVAKKHGDHLLDPDERFGFPFNL
mmetsp:Transcript_51597/g.148832  ORF Transcript_51597/g.148832 Transcript_51597/m.148832 type:complete len:431 (-) Transcript_51597:112-1404(-)